jgi:hypothetical protein
MGGIQPLHGHQWRVLDQARARPRVPRDIHMPGLGGRWHGVGHLDGWSGPRGALVWRAEPLSLHHFAPLCKTATTRAQKKHPPRHHLCTRNFSWWSMSLPRCGTIVRCSTDRFVVIHTRTVPHAGERAHARTDSLTHARTHARTRTPCSLGLLSIRATRV